MIVVGIGSVSVYVSTCVDVTLSNVHMLHNFYNKSGKVDMKLHKYTKVLFVPSIERVHGCIMSLGSWLKHFYSPGGTCRHVLR